jgi:hypothetical protein
MLDKKRGYAYDRPFYDVDTNVNIWAGMVAFLTVNAAGATVATTAASGTVPIGTFWKDSALTYIRTTVETGTFVAANTINLSKGNVLGTTFIKVTNAAGTTVYTQGVDYTVSTTNGVVTRLATGAIAALASVVIWYTYTLQTTQVYWDNVSTQWTAAGQNYDRQPDDTLGSGKITVSEGDAKLYTDQYDVNQTYTLNAPLYSNNLSQWTTVAGYTNACGRVLSIPTANDPFLGLQQITVAQ